MPSRLDALEDEIRALGEELRGRQERLLSVLAVRGEDRDTRRSEMEASASHESPMPSASQAPALEDIEKVLAEIRQTLGIIRVHAGATAEKIEGIVAGKADANRQAVHQFAQGYGADQKRVSQEWRLRSFESVLQRLGRPDRIDVKDNGCLEVNYRAAADKHGVRDPTLTFLVFEGMVLSVWAHGW